MSRALLVKLFEANSTEIAANDLGETWLDFWRKLQTIKSNGYSESHGELDPGLHGLGVPVLIEGGVVGSVTLVFSSERARVLSRDGLVEQMLVASGELSTAIRGVYSVNNAAGSVRPLEGNSV